MFATKTLLSKNSYYYYTGCTQGTKCWQSPFIDRMPQAASYVLCEKYCSHLLLPQFFCNAFGSIGARMILQDFYNVTEATHINKPTLHLCYKTMTIAIHSKINAQMLTLWYVEKHQLIAGFSYEKTSLGCMHLIHTLSKIC